MSSIRFLKYKRRLKHWWNGVFTLFTFKSVLSLREFDFSLECLDTGIFLRLFNIFPRDGKVSSKIWTAFLNKKKRIGGIPDKLYMKLLSNKKVFKDNYIIVRFTPNLSTGIFIDVYKHKIKNSFSFDINFEIYILGLSVEYSYYFRKRKI